MAATRIFELLSVLVIVGLVLSVRLPFVRAVELAANEERALEALRALSVAQEEHRDVRGRYGFGSELLEPSDDRPFLDVPHRLLEDGIFAIDGTGYLFRVALPAADARAVFDDPSTIEPRYARIAYAAIAWPVAYGRTGKRVLWLHHDGRIVQTENLGVPYESVARAPRWDAALRDASLGLLGDPVGDSSHAMDAKIWELLEPLEEDEETDSGAPGETGEARERDEAGEGDPDAEPPSLGVADPTLPPSGS